MAGFLIQEPVLIRQSLLLLIAAFSLAGCTSTTYQSKGAMGGHERQKGPGKLELVSYTNTGDVPAKTLQLYVVYRCAQIARENNKPWFVMYDNLINAAKNAPVKLPTVGMHSDTSVASAFFMGVDGPGTNAYNTSEVLAGLKSVVETGNRNPAP